MRRGAVDPVLHQARHRDRLPVKVRSARPATRGGGVIVPTRRRPVDAALVLARVPGGAALLPPRRDPVRLQRGRTG